MAAVPAVAAGLAAGGRRRPGAVRAIRLAQAAAIGVDELVWYVYTAARGWFAPPFGLPLDLCDVVLWLTVYALVTLRPWALDAVYYLGLASSGMAILTPDLGAPFPSYPGVKFFLAHGGVGGGDPLPRLDGHSPAPARIVVARLPRGLLTNVLDEVRDDRWDDRCQRRARHAHAFALSRSARSRSISATSCDTASRTATRNAPSSGATRSAIGSLCCSSPRSMDQSSASRGLLADLDDSNRRMRIRTSGGVEGE